MMDLDFSALFRKMQVSYWDPRIDRWSWTTVSELEPNLTPPYVMMEDETTLDYEAGGVGTGWTIYNENDPHNLSWPSEILAGWFEGSRHAVETELGGGELVVAWAGRLLWAQ